jgi:N-acetylneuraminate epimerase
MKPLQVFTMLITFVAEAAMPQLKWSSIAPLPDSHGIAAPFSGVSGGALLVAGGANFPDGTPWEGGRKVWHKEVWVLDQPDGHWRSAGQLNRQLAYGVSVTHDDEVICAGGGDETRHYGDVFALRWQGGTLNARLLPALPQPLANACGAVVDGTLYIAGGITTPTAANASSGFFALNLNVSNTTWRALPTWPGVSRMLALSAAQDGAFFLIGGVRLRAGERGLVREYLRDGYRFDANKGWRRISDLPFPAAAAPAPAPALGSDSFLVLASDDGSRANVAASPEHPGFNGRVLAYDVKQNTWMQIGTNPAPRVTVPVTHWKDQWIIPSGEVRPGVRSPQVWSLKLAPAQR